MSLDTITANLWNRLTAIAKPNVDFEAVKSGVDAASGAVMANYTRGTSEGPSVIDKFEEFSQVYLEAFGIKYESEDKKSQYGQYMRGMLNRLSGDAYSNFITAIEIDDINGVLNLAKDAVVSNNSSAETESIVSRILRLTSEQAIAFGKQAAEKIGGTNYLSVLRNIPGYIQALKQTNIVQQAYAN